MYKNSLLFKRCLAALTVVGAGALPLVALAQNAIQSVTGALQGGSEIVRIELAQPLTAVPTGFAIQAPARIALDIAGATNAVGKSVVSVNQGNLNTVNIVEAGERTRLVLNLKQPTTYKAELQGKDLLIMLDPVSSVSKGAPQASTVFAQDGNTDTQPLRDVDFRRSTDGAGRIVVSLANNQVGVDLRPQGKGLVVEFLHSSLPEGLRRRLDVKDFATPVQTVTTTQQGDRVRMVIEPIGEWEHNAYQSDTQFVVEVRQKKSDPDKLTPGPGFSGEKLSLNFQNIDVRSLLQVIADFTNFNIVTSDTVTGALTLRLKDVPWDQALQIVMDSKGLGMRKTGSVLWIAPKDEIDEREKKDMEAAQARQKLEPLRTQSYQLNYAKASDLVGKFTGTDTGGGGGGGSSKVRFLTERGSAIAEPRTNQLFVTDTPSKLEEVKALLAKLDIPIRQVQIEARIVEARDTFGRSLGVRLGATDLRANRGGDGGYGIGGGNRVAWGTDYSNAVGSSGAATGTTNTQGNFVNLPAILSSVPTVGSFALSIFNSTANRFLTLELSAMEADGKGKVLSSPRLITADQTKAMIEQGNEFPTQAFENNTYKILWKKAVLKLEVTPQITPEGNIIMDLDITRDNRGDITPWGISVNTRHVQTQVLVENGGTVAIGGVFEMEETNTENKIPVLGDVPVLGNLFRSQTRESEKRELLIFVTPKVVTDKVATN